MIPIHEDDQALILDALDDYIATAKALLEGEPDREDADLIEDRCRSVSLFKDRIERGDWLVFDTQPVCMVSEKGVKCDQPGRYQPFMYVYEPGAKMPLAQLAVQPILRICGKHATNRLSDYITEPQWRQIQQQVMKQKPGTLVLWEDCKVMYMDHGQGIMVEPPTVKLADLTGGNHGGN